MTRRTDARNLSIQLTPEQYAVLENAAALRKVDISTLVRDTLGQGIPEFKAAPDLLKRGKYNRSNA